MQKTYTESETGETVNNHPVTDQIGHIEAAFDRIGRPVDIRGRVTPPAGTEAHEKGLLVTPDLPEELERALDEIGWVSVRAEIKETFGDPSSSAEITNVVVRNGLRASDIIEMLSETEYSDDDDTDMLTKIVHLVELVDPSEEDPETVVAYDILRKSLGWKAERMLAATDDFYKMLASMDDQGGDLGATKACPFETGEKDGFQLKTMQRVTSQSLHTSEHEWPHLSYAWTSEGINVADMEERRRPDEQAKAVAADAGTNGTEVKKSHDGGTMSDLGRPGRVIAWE